ncbi:MAG: single-stranded DNA-binding protein [Selenomonadaceae bacterium]|nr:single-stranded DNA-binding protein [Selenomonadaceae bacterium]
MNKVFLSGNLTRDVEVRYSQSGKAFARMGIAVRRQFSKDKDAVDFFNLVAWDKTAEFCGRYLIKGSRVLVEGRLQTSSYEKDGVKVNAVDIMVDNIEFAGSRPAGSGSGDDNYSRPANDGGYSRPASNSYSRQPAEPDSYGGRNSAPQKRSDYEFGGEPIDPEDTPF